MAWWLVPLFVVDMFIFGMGVVIADSQNASLENEIGVMLDNFLEMFIPGTTFTEFMSVGWFMILSAFVILFIGLYLMIVPPKKAGGGPR